MNGITYAIIACNIDKGMKSCGSKTLIQFDKQTLLDYQINQIKAGHKKKIPYEIILITNFEFNKISKTFGSKIIVYHLDDNKNPIIQTCNISKFKTIFFIDYGCVYTKETISEVSQLNNSYILTTKDKNNTLDIGVSINYDNGNAQYLFFDLTNDKFSNMFILQEYDTNKIMSAKKLSQKNLMYFEILNYLLDNGTKILNHCVKNKTFIYFNNVRQKNAISKFIRINS